MLLRSLWVATGLLQPEETLQNLRTSLRCLVRPYQCYVSTLECHPGFQLRVPIAHAGTSKAAKRRQKEKEKEQARSLAERVGRPGETEVLNSGRPAVMGQSREGGTRRLLTLLH